MAKRTPAAKKAPAAEPLSPRISTLLDRHALLIVIGLVLLATIRIAATYTVFNHTFDEPAHISCGMEWLDKGTYTLEPQHPPLARVAVALGPYLLGRRLPPNETDIFISGRKILDSGHQYDLTLALARAGVLPFFWIACAVVYWWGLRYYSRPVAVVALALFSFLPPVLAHAGMATTDMALTAFLCASFLTGMIWLEEPTPVHSVWFGAATGLAMLSKFSTLAFLPAAAGLALICYFALERPALADVMRAVVVRLPQFGIAVLVACLLVWAGYRFSFGKVWFADLKLPAPELYAGIKQMLDHNASGHTGYLLGMRRTTGFWYFYEVALAVKTPLAFLFLVALGLGKTRDLFSPSVKPLTGQKRRWPVLLFCAGILLIGAFSRINIGIRHVLPLYAGLSLIAAVALLRLLEMGDLRPWIRSAAGALVVWFAVTSLVSHPDYLPYFNFLAGNQPERILVDSDLDWGQDTKRLGARLREVQAPNVAFVTALTADLQGEFGFPPVRGFHPSVPDPGWNAVSVSKWKEARLGLGDTYLDAPLWPDDYMNRLGQPGVPEPERIGKGILLWYIPPR